MHRVSAPFGLITLCLISASHAVAQGEAAGIDVEQIPARVVLNEQGEERRVFPARLLCGRVDAGVPEEQVATGAPPAPDGRPDATGTGDRGDGRDRIGIAGGEQRLDLFDPQAPGMPDDAAAAREPPLLAGAYRTLITVYNPNGVAAYPVIRVVPTTPALTDGRAADKIPPLGERLPPRRGLEIDCADLVDLLAEAFRLNADFLSDSFAGGLLVVEAAARELDVTAVYTFRPGG